MLRRTTLAKGCIALAVVLAGTGLVLAFPNPAPIWLSIKGTGDDARTAAYYAAIGAPATFSAWKAAYGFNGANDIRATYYNAADLGFGREMHCRQNGSDTACYVINHGLGPGAPAQLSVAAAVSNQQTLAAVAMVYHGAMSGQPNDVQFFIYNVQTDQRLNGVALDSQGTKYAPLMCLACHGGTHPVTDTQILGAHFLPFDLASFRYSGQPGFTQATQAEALRQLNALVRNTNPPSPEAQLIDGWYHAGSVNTAGTPFDAGYVPPSYQGTPDDTALYQNVVERYCRSCHVTQTPTDLSTPAQVDAARYVVYSSNIMPHAELTNHNFWSSSTPAFLANNRGWSLRVTRTDDPAPGSCAPGDCSLREAILVANASGGPYPSIITFDVNGTFTLSQAGTDDLAAVGDLDLTEDVMILGNGPAQTVINGNSIDRVFQVLGGAHAVIRGVTIEGGRVSGDGGGLDNVGSVLDLANSVVTNNSVTSFGSAGAGIANRAGATTHIEQSTIGPNNYGRASPNYGGGLYNAGSTLTLDSATVTSNVSDHDAAVYNVGAGAVVTLTQATVAENSGTTGVLDNAPGATLWMGNSIVTGNGSGACLLQPGSAYHSLGHNLLGEGGSTDGCALSGGDQVVSGSAQAVLEIFPVKDLSGLIYHPLVPGSPAIGAIPVGSGCSLPSYDERNSPRPAGGGQACDLGAREFVPAAVTTNVDVVGDDGQCSLREAMAAANTGTASGLKGGECPAGPDTIMLSAPGPYDLTSGELSLNGPVILYGQGQTIRRTSGNTRLIHVMGGAMLNLIDATLRDGSLPSFSFCISPCYYLSGGAISIEPNGAANILNSAIVNSKSFTYGGGIFNQGWINIANSTLSGNSAAWDGGGLDNLGTVLLTNVTIAGNTAGTNGGSFGDGGGLATGGTTVFIKNSLVAGNFDVSTGAHTPDVYYGPGAIELTSYDYNLIGDGTGSAGHFGGHDQVGTALAPINARLGPLTGAPPYLPLLDGSPALDQIPPAECRFFSAIGNPLFVNDTAVSFDQRGAPRPANFTRQSVAKCDIGAVERLVSVFLPLIQR